MPKISFVLVATENGPMIVNRYDWARNETCGSKGHGVSAQLFERGHYEQRQCATMRSLLTQRRAARDGKVVAIDVGANIGAFTVPLAQHMKGWGVVRAVEPQRFIYYTLCGNIALNNLFNAHAYLFALGAREDVAQVPRLDYEASGCYGSLSLLPGKSADVGQDLTNVSDKIPICTLESLTRDSDRLDLIKVDVEGMELDVLRGGAEIIEKERPILFVEHTKSDRRLLRDWVEVLGYSVMQYDDGNFLCVHVDDPCLRLAAAMMPISEIK